MWETKKLGELARFYSGGTPSKSIAEYWDGNIPWISAKNMKTDRVSTSELFITQEGLDNGSKLAPRGSLLLLVRGSGLFNGIPICYVEEAVAYNQDIKCIQSCSEVENEYIYYWLKANSEYLQKRLDVTGIGAGKFDTNFLSELEVSYPDEKTRKIIVEFSNNLTDKILLNAQINRNLSEQVAALYKAWFIDFERNDGVCPEEWKEATLGDIAEIGSGKRPPMKQTDKSDDACIPLIGAASIMGYTNSVLYDSKILVTGRVGTHGVVQRFNNECWPSDNTLVITTDKYEFVNQILLGIDYKSMNRGSTQPLITQGDLKKTEIILPTDAILDEFEALAGGLMNQYEKNILENAKLSELRDTLLPKLMSGELDVSDMDF